MNKRKLWLILAVAAAALVLAVTCIYLLRSPESPVIYSDYTPKTDIICIDAGHGGSDGGATFGSRLEKDDNLALALLVAKYVEEAGYTPLLTRNGDKYLSLGERCEIANDRSAAYFISLHRNSAEGGRGVEVWIGSSVAPAEKKLAQKILTALQEVGVQSSRGVKAGTQASVDTDYAVNKNTEMPSCIVELGFMQNEEDNRLFDEHLDAYARAIARAVTSLMKK